MRRYLSVGMGGSYAEDQELPCNKLTWTSTSVYSDELDQCKFF